MTSLGGVISHKSLRVFASIVVVGILVGGCDASPDTTADTPSPDPAVECDVGSSSTDPATEPVAAPEIPDALEVIESGYTYTDIHDSKPDLRGYNITFGALIGNNSDLVARNVTADVVGHVDDEVHTFPSTHIPYLMPGESFALGATDNHNWAASGARFEQIEIKVDAEEWWPVNNTEFKIHQVTLSDIEPSNVRPTGYIGLHEDADLYRLSAYSCAPEGTETLAMALYRDQHGAIVGGAIYTDTIPCDEQETGQRFFTPGWDDYCFYSLPGLSMFHKDLETALEGTVNIDIYPLAVEETKKLDGSRRGPSPDSGPAD